MRKLNDEMMEKLNDEEVGEAICEYSDRQIVVSVFERMTLKQQKEILNWLFKDWGGR